MNRLCCSIIALLALVRAAQGASLLDPTFQIGSSADNLIEQVLPLEDGRVLVCGAWNNFNGVPRAWIARLNEDGSLDDSFKPNVGYWVRHMAVQPDGKIVIGGFFHSVEGQSRNLVARLNPDGSLDRSFNPGSGGEELVVPGDPNPPCVFWVTVQPDGKVLLAGSFAKFNGQTVNGIVRLNSDGSRDSTFQSGSGLDSWGRFILVQPNGQILLTGWMTIYNGQSFNRMVRLNPDGTPDQSFHPFFGDKTAIYTAALLPDGKMIVAGHSKNEQGLFHREMERLNPDGSVDESFIGRTNEKTESLFVQPDGKIVVGGYFSLADDSDHNLVARFNPDGTVDETFNVHIGTVTGEYVWTVALDNKGRILCSGGFETVDGTRIHALARLLPGADYVAQPPQSELRLNSFAIKDGKFTITIASVQNTKYTLEYREEVPGGYWISFPTVAGNGGDILLTDTTSGLEKARFYRVKIE